MRFSAAITFLFLENYSQNLFAEEFQCFRSTYVNIKIIGKRFYVCGSFHLISPSGSLNKIFTICFNIAPGDSNLYKRQSVGLNLALLNIYMTFTRLPVTSQRYLPVGYFKEPCFHNTNKGQKQVGNVAVYRKIIVLIPFRSEVPKFFLSRTPYADFFCFCLIILNFHISDNSKCVFDI